jgi:transcriptional regulator GlxA family with amidase domain
MTRRGLNPQPPGQGARQQQLLRLERAEHLIGHGATVEAAARTVGFTDARMLRRLRAREPA